MKLELESADIQAIVLATTTEVVKALKPLLNSKIDGDTIFNIESLCEYLHVEQDWIYKRTARKEIPYIKVGGLLRFRKKNIDKWLESCMTPAVNPLSNRLNGIKLGRPTD